MHLYFRFCVFLSEYIFSFGTIIIVLIFLIENMEYRSEERNANTRLPIYCWRIRYTLYLLCTLCCVSHRQSTVLLTQSSRLQNSRGGYRYTLHTLYSSSCRHCDCTVNSTLCSVYTTVLLSVFDTECFTSQCNRVY